ncbi:hypothetical protein [Kitasatospora brasiliensis]|uniref:hypothetical protein n=1 Tax=Kitasatospora brasiliensis TaxID=3058040 RepID=UPI00292DF6BC|nr:hypothetical protein [Kitasatospora sp. K002]
MPLFRRRSGGEGEQDRAGRRGFGFGLGRRGAGSAAPAGGGEPRLDQSYGDESARLALRQALAGDWAELRPLLAAADNDQLSFLIGVMSEVPRVEQWTSRALADTPDDTLLLLLSGARHVQWGWEARTGGWAKDVTEERWKLFHKRLDIAEEQLLEVAEREPSWHAPWSFLQRSALGASLGPEVAACRFEAAVRRAPGIVGPYRTRLQQLSAKWGGSHEEMHEFARATMLAAPEGSQLGELVALAHLEHWLALPEGEDGAYLTSPAVVAGLQEAAFRSVLHPDFIPVRGWQRSFNAFAMAFSLADQPKTARLLFDALDNCVTDAPWHYLAGDPVRSFRVHRDRCASYRR